MGACADDKAAERVAAKSVVGDTTTLRRALVTDRLTNEQTAGSAPQALLRFWTLLQSQAWSDAVSTYEPGLIEIVGVDRVIDALKQQASYFRATRPVELSMLSIRPGIRTVRFLVRGASGDPVSRSVTFRRRGSSWRIFYDPFLNDALQFSAQSEVQLRVAPGKEALSGEALRAGDAASRLQSRWLEQARKDPRLALG